MNFKVLLMVCAWVAIVPLASHSPDPGDEYFADGMTEQMISSICTISGLKVISRTSAMKYKETKKSIPEIGRELNVGSIFEGSVRKAGSKVRISVQLIDVCTDEHLWSQTCDREFQDIFQIQSDIAKQVSESLRVNLLAVEKRIIEKGYTQDTEAHNLYLKGRFHLHKGTRRRRSSGLRRHAQRELADYSRSKWTPCLIACAVKRCFRSSSRRLRGLLRI